MPGAIISSVYGLECIYCGEPATDRDHVVPHSLTSKVERSWTTSEVVPACRDCNGSLHNRPLLTIAARADWLLRRLFRKQGSLKGRPWTDEELMELGETLRKYVVSQENKRLTLERRIHRCQAVTRLADLTPSKYWDTQFSA